MLPYWDGMQQQNRQCRGMFQIFEKLSWWPRYRPRPNYYVEWSLLKILSLCDIFKSLPTFLVLNNLISVGLPSFLRSMINNYIYTWKVNELSPSCHLYSPSMMNIFHRPVLINMKRVRNAEIIYHPIEKQYFHSSLVGWIQKAWWIRYVRLGTLNEGNIFIHHSIRSFLWWSNF